MFRKYFEKGLSVIPCYRNSKNPAIEGWSKYCHTLATEDEIDKWSLGNYNIGLALGPASGVVVLDIDTDDKEILDMCPRSPVVRRGKKGEARFFKWTKDIPSISRPKIDILSIGRQVILPPSIHPETKKHYVWLTVDTLENFDACDLPELDLSFMPTAGAKLSIEPIGRNNKLVDIVTSMRGRGEEESKIIDEVYEWDKYYHVPRLFLDGKEGYRGSSEDDAKRNAWRFVLSVTKSLVENGTAILTSTTITVDESTPIASYKAMEFPKPEGLLLDIQNLIIDISSREMPNIALGGAIALMAVLISNKYRFDTTWANVYVLNLAPSGSGKSYPQLIVEKILEEKLGANLLGFGNYRSSSAIVKNLVSRRERLDVIDEVSSLFAQIKSGGLYQSEMMEDLCKLWSSSNRKFTASEYAEKADTSTCYNACVSMLGSTTIEGIKENITRLMITKGLIPRFLIFSHEDYGKSKNSFCNDILIDKIVAQLSVIIELKKREMTIGKINTLHGPQYDPINVAPIDINAQIMFDSIKKDFDASVESKTIDEPIKKILSRGKEQIMKLSMIHAVSRGSSHVECIDLEWARKTFDVSMHNSKMLIQETSVSNEHEKDFVAVRNFISKKGGATLGVISNGFRRIPPQKMKQILEHLVTSGEIVSAKVKHQGNGTELVKFIPA